MQASHRLHLCAHLLKDFGMANTQKMRLPSGEWVVVSAWGGQVLSGCKAFGHERLYLSPQARAAFASGNLVQPSLDGVPVCFPKFAIRGPGTKQGRVRQAWWQVSEPRLLGDADNTDECVLRWPGASIEGSEQETSPAWGFT